MNTTNVMDVKAADNSLQLNGSIKSSASTPFPHTKNIYELNDDCLFYIFQHLDFKDQLNLARSSNRFHYAFVLCFRYNSEKFNIDDYDWKHFTMYERQEFLSYVGKYITRINGAFNVNKDNFELFCMLCPNVNSLELYEFPGTNQFNQIVDSMQMITALYLGKSGNNVVDLDISTLKKLPQLNKLTVRSPYISGRYFNELKKLEFLDLCECASLQSNYLIEILKALLDLQTLCIIDCDAINVDVFLQMVRSSIQLESLRIDPRVPGCEIIARLPSLKYLELSMERFSNPMPENIAKIFNEIANHADQLGHLKLVGSTIIKSLPPTLNCLKNVIVLNLVVSSDMNDECLKCFSSMENLEKLTIRCHRFTIESGLDHLLANCKRLSHVEITNIIACHVRVISKFIERMTLMLRNSIPGRILPVTVMFDELARPEFPGSDDERAVNDIINIISSSRWQYQQERKTKFSLAED